ncbi:hypothetical protein [Longimicrobium sp.]|uniref:hypothetical protein n=1 Tax=Longimicrobium sp. TaxID=2029185 RepID=UPI002E372E52|nr:hypothetical protein [Longimicrobium sp.]HEX6036679.1 hypothetical protein [Longimicrobium sp.]
MNMRRAAVPLLLLLIAACTPAPRRPAAVAPPPVAPPVVRPPAPPPIVQFQNVWTRDAGTQLRTDAGGVPLPYVFMRLEVLRADTADLLVRCPVCPGTPEGWIERARVVHAPLRPADAARLDLADFVLSVREAAAQRDVEALRSVMARDFVHTLGPLEMGLLETFASWEREGYRTLDRMPFLLDRGVATVVGTPVWAAPPEYASQQGYGDLRAGFRRGPDGWEWIFLVRGGA